MSQSNRPERGKRIETLGVFEMVWDCRFCGTPNQSAKSALFCTNCGAAQDPAARRFPSDEEKRAVTEHVFKGANLICAACSTPNEGDATFCRQCGASLENAARATTVADQTRGDGEVFAAQAERDLAKERFDSEMKRVGVTQDAPKRRNWLPYAIAAAVVLLVIGGIYALTLQRDTAATIVGHTWERSIRIQQFTAVEDAAWCDQMPSDAYNVTDRREQRSTNRVPDGETCEVRRIDNGDGTFREQNECTTRYREEPVYDNRCYYTLDQWTESRQLVSQGDNLSQPLTWPLTNFSCNGQRLGCEREGGREEDYILVLQGENGNTFECPVDQEFWQSAEENTRWTVEVGVITGAPDCESLQPAA